MDDDGPLYQASTGISHPLVTLPSPDVMDGAFNSAGDNASQLPVRPKPLQTSTASQTSRELHTLVAKIERKSLDWGGTFPGNQEFYRTRDMSDDDVFTLKPKPRSVNENGKRGDEGRSSDTSKRARFG
ncbi:hypothetical protein EJ02DRAFT_464348 [Clathrospora elynae]|uniref:Uncharacterized protein n=1 Tax=Clathrospora elynae TaxID=706981 RepID=A0A6A5SVM6_9PLEO|nr:hypothetical protein EJ02DRAFT_464348 [Clathrospora elynae]